MNNVIKKSAFALLGLSLLSSSLLARECYDADRLDVKWVSYKTMAKIGVGGNFSKVAFVQKSVHASSVESMLLGAQVSLDLANLNAHMDLKNANIAEYFTAQLQSHKISSEITAAKDGKLLLSLTLNGITKKIPMTYTQKESSVVATGVIDALDFDLIKALRLLNKNVAGHKNKGWNDISIAFTMPYTTQCN